MELITLDELKIISAKEKFNIVLLEKDYLLTLLLYHIRDIDGIYFKGGTALNKIFLNHQRLSEDLDFSLSISPDSAEKQIRAKLKGTFFKNITYDNKYNKFIRLNVFYKLFHEKGNIVIDLTEKSDLTNKPVKLILRHFYYENIPDFELNCLDIEEMTAEKIRATCQRYKQRDYYDLYYIIKKNLPINLKTVEKKFKESNSLFDVGLIFKNTNKIFREWNDDLFYLTKSKIDFKEVMKTLKDYFNYKKQ